MKRIMVRRLSLAMFALAGSPVLGQPKAPPVEVSLHASVSAIAPGQAFEVAIKFEIPEGYHLYWENPGESGKPPTVNWRLPDGFSVSPLRFPPPKRHEAAGIVTYVL